jgi:sulfur relay (sulfurtransferase) complex TusBCD TusD component (DsrE family)
MLFIIKDGPYGNERAYNALRLSLNVVNGSVSPCASS